MQEEPHMPRPTLRPALGPSFGLVLGLLVGWSCGFPLGLPLVAFRCQPNADVADRKSVV